MKRQDGMAYIGKVVLVEPIEGADKIERIEVVCGKGGKWSAVSQKGTFLSGDLCEVYLPDALLPETDPRFSFMEKHHYRVRIMRLRGVPSEALVMPLGQFEEAEDFISVGTDITHYYGIDKYEKPLPASIGGDILGAFPSYIPKTDEPNFQAAGKLIHALEGIVCVSTIKADGTSTTAYIDKDTQEFNVCSGNWRIKESDKNALWQIARKYDVENILRHSPTMALQWETVGPGIQKNPLGLKEPSMLVFDAYDFVAHDYIPMSDLEILTDLAGLPMVKNAAMGVFHHISDERLRALADRVYDNGKPAEGVVIRPYNETLWVEGDRLSFKVINGKYKD